MGQNVRHVRTSTSDRGPVFVLTHLGGADLYIEVPRLFSYFALLRVAWTLADLAESPHPTANHVAAALEFRERRSLY